VAPRILANAIPGDDKAFVAKVVELINSFEDSIDWFDEEQSRTFEERLHESYPEAQVIVKPHPLNPPTWDFYRDGGPRRVQLS
jgi:hypothetical protein